MYKDELEEMNRIWHVLIDRLQVILSHEKFRLISELSTTELSILQLLNDYPNVILKEMCARLNIPKSTLTSAINRLVKKGYAERVSNSSDKRAFSLHITETGAAVQKKHLELENSMLEQLLDELEQSEIETLLRLLNKAIGGDRQ